MMALPDLQQIVAPVTAPPSQPPSVYSNMVTAKDLASFRSKFSALATVDDATIAGQFDIVDVEIGNGFNWVSQADFQLARLALCAHFVMLDQQQASDVELGGVGMSDMYVRTIRFGERLTGFAQRKAFETLETMAGPGETLLSSTPYCQLFIRLRARNIIPVAIV